MNDRIVLLRGLVRGTGHWADFPKVLRKKNPNCEIEFFEIPGNGTRYSEETPIDPKLIIDDFRKKSSFCQSKKPFVLCGISLGGMLALKWLELYPNDIKKTVVINSSLARLSSFYQRLRPQNYVKIFKTFFLPTIAEQEKSILSLTSNRVDHRSQTVDSLIEFSKLYPVKPKNFVRQLMLANNIDVTAPLQPSVIIVSSEQDRLVNPICSKHISESIHSELRTHPTAGHDVPLDDPEWLAGIILN